MRRFCCFEESESFGIVGDTECATEDGEDCAVLKLFGEWEAGEGVGGVEGFAGFEEVGEFREGEGGEGELEFGDRGGFDGFGGFLGLGETEGWVRGDGLSW